MWASSEARLTKKEDAIKTLNPILAILLFWAAIAAAVIAFDIIIQASKKEKP